mmetsp:Transcript_136778/g.354747  ORF Transcript_136778/g.354747 Transcript_136778/m.354747 type:complete len:209 (+) Transcript_136778:32-658(+)
MTRVALKVRHLRTQVLPGRTFKHGKISQSTARLARKTRAIYADAPPVLAISRPLKITGLHLRPHLTSPPATCHDQRFRVLLRPARHRRQLRHSLQQVLERSCLACQRLLSLAAAGMKPKPATRPSPEIRCSVCHHSQHLKFPLLHLGVLLAQARGAVVQAVAAARVLPLRRARATASWVSGRLVLPRLAYNFPQALRLQPRSASHPLR